MSEPSFAAGLRLDVDDRFDDASLDPSIWVAEYLPQWTESGRAGARFETGSGLTLRIDADQPAWREEDGGLRVSNLQTATFSGPVGSSQGTHRHQDGMIVRTEVPRRPLWTPTAGAVEVTMAATADPTCLSAVWLVGVEADSPDDSGEITVVELFGDRIHSEHSLVRAGVKAINDPRLADDIVDIDLPFDARQPHRYGAAWDDRSVRIFVDDRLIRTVAQSLAYPLQLMIDLFEFPTGADRDVRDYPKRIGITRVRCYS